MSRKNVNQNEIDKDAKVTKRLDALIRLFIEMNKSKTKKEFNNGTAIRILKSVGLAPTEIAKILGKKSRTAISGYLYRKNKK